MKVSYFEGSKYGNKSCWCNSGHCHQSRLEAGYCNLLALLVKAGEIRSYKTQVKYELKVNGIHITNHYVDFVVETKDGKEEVRETKGMVTDVWKIKYNLFLALYPGIKYEIITSGRNPYARFKQRKRRRPSSRVF